MKGELYINALDAYTTWGITLGEGALTALLSPPPVKPLVENKSRAAHGKEVITDYLRLDSRELTLEINLVAPSRETFLVRYGAFCQMLSSGPLRIETRYQPGVVYHCHYLSCQQFAHYHQGAARFALRLEEPDPTRRTYPAG